MSEEQKGRRAAGVRRGVGTRATSGGTETAVSDAALLGEVSVIGGQDAAASGRCQTRRRDTAGRGGGRRRCQGARRRFTRRGVRHEVGAAADSGVVQPNKYDAYHNKETAASGRCLAPQA
jgi:hypothetical protein